MCHFPSETHQRLGLSHDAWQCIAPLLCATDHADVALPLLLANASCCRGILLATVLCCIRKLPMHACARFIHSTSNFTAIFKLVKQSSKWETRLQCTALTKHKNKPDSELEACLGGCRINQFDVAMAIHPRLPEMLLALTIVDFKFLRGSGEPSGSSRLRWTSITSRCLCLISERHSCRKAEHSSGIFVHCWH